MSVRLPNGHIDWDFVSLIDALKSEAPADLAKRLNISISAVNSRMNSENLDSKGNFIDRPKIRWNKSMLQTLKRISLRVSNLDELASVYGVNKDRLAAAINKYKVRAPFDPANNSSPATRRGRAAEVFVRDLPWVKCRRDCAVEDGPTHPYDLILAKYGAVSVKHTIIVNGDAKFDVEGTRRPTKFVFLVAYEQIELGPKHLFILPFEEAWRKSSVRIPVFPVRGHYSQFEVDISTGERKELPKLPPASDATTQSV